MAVALPGDRLGQTDTPPTTGLTHRSGGQVCDTHTALGERTERTTDMIILGAVLLIIGLVAKVPVLWSIGVVLVAIGAVLYLLGAAGREIGGRRHYW